MKSLILKEPGQSPDIRVFDIPEPILTSDGVIVKVAAVGLCHHDISVMDGTLRRGTKADVILGHEISGTVVDIGDDVSSVGMGDRVVTTLTSSCGVCAICRSGNDYLCKYGFGYGHGINGGFAEYIAVGEQNLINIGNIDLAGTIGSYIGLFFMCALFSSINIFTSSITSNQVTAFLFGILLNLLWFYGFDLISEIEWLTYFDLIIQKIGISYHYQYMSKGLLRFVDIFSPRIVYDPNCFLFVFFGGVWVEEGRKLILLQHRIQMQFLQKPSVLLSE